MAQKHNAEYTEHPMTRDGHIQGPSRRYRRLRNPTFPSTEWTAKNPLLQRGEIGAESDTHRIKVGDGTTYWNDLPYASDAVATWGAINGDIADQTDLVTALNAKQDKLTAGDGISIDSDNIIANSGVRSVATGTTDGTVSVNTGGTSAEVSVAGWANKADTDLSNLTNTGKNIANWSSNVTNAIVNIPQDLNLTLNSGTLTLKAGSKVYIPNGSGTFDAYTLPSDSSLTPSGFSTSQNRIGMLAPNKTFVIITTTLQYTFSGPTAPTTFDGNGRALWYDTTNNIIKLTNDSGSTWQEGFSFPIVLFNITNGIGVTQVNQVFNGFGYIGSTVFALPSVKALAPDGRNAESALKNTIQTNTSTLTLTENATSSKRKLCFSGSSLYALPYANSKPSTGYVTYQEDENFIYNSLNKLACSFAGDVEYDSNGKISSFSSYYPFRTVDYNDTDFIVHQAMPGTKYSNLTLPASGGTITAPADGYLTINKSATAANQYINFINGSNGMNCNVIAPSALPLRLYMPVSKGNVITINYDAAGTTTMFRFIYANGAK